MSTTTTFPIAAPSRSTNGSSRTRSPERPRKPKPVTPQLTATSRATAFHHDTRPPLCKLALPGPRRAQEGRGGALDASVAVRCIIRNPALTAFGAALPARTTGRPPAVPDLFWVFYLAATRYFRVHEKLDAWLKEHWEIVREEFWFEHSILLPNAKPGEGEVPDDDDFRGWRARNVLAREATHRRPARASRVPQLAEQLTATALPLALAIRSAEGGDVERPLHDPAIWDLLSVDGTVLGPPSDVTETIDYDENGVEVGRTTKGSRATKGKPRVHEAVMENVGKKHGASRGLFNVAAVTKGLDTYTRVVMAVEIGQAHEGEDPVAIRLLRRLYGRIGQTIPVLLYDGAMKPVYYQDLMAEYGIYCVNATNARPTRTKKGKAGAKRTKKAQAGKSSEPLPGDAAEDPTRVGHGMRRYGIKKGQPKLTYDTPLDSIHHPAGGKPHEHHLVADDGAVYETTRPVLGGGNVTKTALLEPIGLERLSDDGGEYYLRLTLAGACPHGDDFTVAYDLRKTALDRKGHLPWRSLVANVRVIPDALVERFGSVYGQRNQIEAFFSWLEACFVHKDRHASWGREAQLLDLVGASLWHNTLTWAHLAYRHPEQAEQYRRDMKALCQDTIGQANAPTSSLAAVAAVPLTDVPAGNPTSAVKVTRTA